MFVCLRNLRVPSEVSPARDSVRREWAELLRPNESRHQSDLSLALILNLLRGKHRVCTRPHETDTAKSCQTEPTLILTKEGGAGDSEGGGALVGVADEVSGSGEQRFLLYIVTFVLFIAPPTCTLFIAMLIHYTYCIRFFSVLFTHIHNTHTTPGLSPNM